MDNQNLREIPLMSQEGFEENLNNTLFLKTFEATKRFKSVRRAIRKGLVSPDGIIYPKRPFNNAKHKKKGINDRKKKIYEQLKHKQKQFIEQLQS